ncbi:type II secretion system protein M [Marinobacter sp. C2H3]|uniref:type II secretion system protein M n=1 Tax=Marinobacter sp. C2H3 TaxID=3119003 RepID=UPI00300F6CD6
MFQRLKEQPTVGRLIALYDQLPKRDRQALQVLALALALAFVYFALWRPVSGFRAQAADDRAQAAELLAWVQANQSTIQGLSGKGAAASAAVDKPADGRALMALVTRSAGESKLTLQRFEPSGDGAIRVWLDDVPYASLAAWLENLSVQHGVVIDQAAMDRANAPGRVSARLTLAL